MKDVAYLMMIPCTYLLLSVFIFHPAVLKAWLIPKPIENTWVTLTKTMNQDTFCLRMDSPKDPLQTCLIGLNWDIYKFRYYRPKSEITTQNTDITWRFTRWILNLPNPPEDTFIHDVHLLMSTSPSICVYFKNEFNHPDLGTPKLLFLP